MLKYSMYSSKIIYCPYTKIPRYNDIYICRMFCLQTVTWFYFSRRHMFCESLTLGNWPTGFLNGLFWCHWMVRCGKSTNKQTTSRREVITWTTNGLCLSMGQYVDMLNISIWQVPPHTIHRGQVNSNHAVTLECWGVRINFDEWNITT